jgi:glucose/arabinose dehydrogenase
MLAAKVAPSLFWQYGVKCATEAAMKRTSPERAFLLFFSLAAVCAGISVTLAWPQVESARISTGAAAFSTTATEKPGVFRKITVADLPDPYATPSAANQSQIVSRPATASLQVPPGFQVQLFASGFTQPRELRTAPNGDIFLADSRAGEIKVLHGMKDGKAESVTVFASGFDRPFGMAFYPLGPDPQYIYVGNTNSVVRLPYRNGDLKARGPAEVIVKNLPSGDPSDPNGGGHWTRDLVFSRDGKKMFVAVGSRSNVDDADNNPAEVHRANVLEFSPDGTEMRVFASGIRNCVGEAIQPETGNLWCSTNERDNLGDNVPPDYITHVQDGGFYGWPWYYTGGHPDPRHKGKHPELKDKVIVPDVLLQPHNASLEIAFYEGSQFPQEYRGQIFAAEHGSWNRGTRTGYEVIRVPMEHGKATGAYEDFVTGFVTPDGQVWGRPVGVTVASDGSLLVSDDGSNSVWRVSYSGGHPGGN